MSITREDPPNYRTGPNTSYLEIAEKLKADPGNWYKITEGLRWAELANRIKHGSIHAFRPAGTFEAVSRTIDGSFTIYARYVGTQIEGDVTL